MQNFTEAPDQHTEAQVQVSRAEVPVVQERASMRQLPAPASETPASSRKLPTNSVQTPHSEWEALRDYVVTQLTKIAPFPRDERRENTTFMGFQDRWGEQALPIAVYAFEKAKGEWMGAPVSVARFEKTSDGVFAARIAEMLIHEV